ncbi:MAG: DNA-processing protein DprA [Taibaiella sp.]|nr:DNA-processing protein DprA [Taibaiella sp.]
MSVAAPETQHDEIHRRIALTMVPGVGSRIGRTLLERYGSAAEIFRTPLKELKTVDGITETKARSFRDAGILSAAEKELNFVLKTDINVYSINDEAYPTRLARCADAPLVLYYRGSVPLNSERIVAVVGTRKNTDYGLKLTEDLVDGLAGTENLTIVSGLALGIDAIAHKRCVAKGIPTIGVLGHGLDNIYPFTNKGLAQQMLENGGLLTEFPSGTLPDRGNFPMRNRIVAGMSDVTVVVESHDSGGALITAKLAAGYNREVAAFPGRVNDARSAGCNDLIKINLAALVTSADDIIRMMSWDAGTKKKPVQKQLFLNLSAAEQSIIDMLQTKENAHADELLYHTGLASNVLAATLLQLEMQGLVKAMPGKFYRIS